jgi:hypothetical protein
MSVTITCRPRTEPGGVSSWMPMPNPIAHADPDGWHWTMRKCSFGAWSTIWSKPHVST